MDPIDYALAYAGRGWHVFPVHWPIFHEDRVSCSCKARDCKSTGKHPLTRHGLKDATTDPNQIRAWWQNMPQANLAVRTGEISGLFVVDVDPRHKGDEALARLVRQWQNDWPLAWMAKTSGGGLHYYFPWPDDGLVVPSNKLIEGVDLRGNGGYVVAPPSIHKTGEEYTWLTT